MTTNIPGYTYGSADLKKSPVSMDDFAKLKQASLFNDDDCLNGHEEPAGQLLALATELRTSAAAETLPWVGRLLGFQIATTLAYIQRQQQQQQQRQAG